MSDGVLFRRVLLWHKLIAQVTGGIALTSAKRALNRDQSQEWSRALRNVADEIDSVIAGNGFILDERGQRMVGSGHHEGIRSAERTSDGKLGTTQAGSAVPSVSGGLRTATRKKT